MSLKRKLEWDSLETYKSQKRAKKRPLRILFDSQKSQTRSRKHSRYCNSRMFPMPSGNTSTRKKHCLWKKIQSELIPTTLEC